MFTGIIEETTLLSKKSGDIVNLENDILGKYVQKMLGIKSTSQNYRDEKLMKWLEE